MGGLKFETRRDGNLAEYFFVNDENQIPPLGLIRSRTRYLRCYLRGLYGGHACRWGLRYGDFPQKAGRDVPVLSIVGDNRDCLLVVAGQHTRYWWAPIRLKGDAVANRKLQHVRMRPHLLQKAQPFHNLLVEGDQFCFRKLVNIDVHGSST